MNILLLGSGGREHAFAWKMVQSPLCDTLFMAPGNAGTAEIATNVAIAVTDFEAIKALVIKENMNCKMKTKEKILHCYHESKKPSGMM